MSWTGLSGIVGHGVRGAWPGHGGVVWEIVF